MVHQLVEEKFNLFNVNINKEPINKYGAGMVGWPTKSYEELVAQHNQSLGMVG